MLLAGFPALVLSAEPAVDPPVPEAGEGGKLLQRVPDPVFITGDTLPEEFLGAEIRRLRLYSRRDGNLVPIRFQVDERTGEGDWIFPFGKRNNASRSNGRLDPQDVILFMARDAGPEAKEPWGLPGAPRVLGVELQDPVDAGRGWVYLACYDETGPPPVCALPDYVQYDAENEIIASACTRAEYLITGDGLHTTFYLHHSTPPGAGGTGQNLVDRLKFRVQMRFFFDMLPLSLQEERLGSDRVAYIQGPIRNLRRFQQFVKLPFGIRAVKTYADVELYEGFSTVPISLQIPRGFQRVVSSSRIRYGTDYSPDVIGSFFRNSQEPEALIVDGRMSEAEKRFPSQQDTWRIFYGPYGVLMTRTLFPPDLLEMVEIRQGWLDDLNTAMPVERFPGSIGFAYTEINATRVRPGRYRLSLDFYFPPNYRPGDEQRFLQLRDHPLVIRIGDRETVNPQNLYGQVGSDF
jgi:hypothetical protein